MCVRAVITIYIVRVCVCLGGAKAAPNDDFFIDSSIDYFSINLTLNVV